MKIAELHSLFIENPHICTDTRKSKEGSLFFALKGENFDANDFAQNALEKGCSYAIVDKASVAINSKYVLVENVLKTLQELANFHRNYCKAKIIGITGTNGKTTTKELIHEVLKTSYETVATEGNLNNHIGVPLTLLRLTPTTQIGIIEMGANHPNEIAQLCAISEPDYGIITNVGTGHIEGFGSFEGVLKTKLELYEAVAKKQGALFVHSKNNILSEQLKNYNTKVYSYGTSQDFAAGHYLSASPFLKLSLDETIVQTQLIGAYNFENVLAAYTIGKFFEVAKDNSLQAISDYLPSNNRSQLIETGKNTILLDAYNANPTSMRAAILNFAQTNYSAKRLILGDMLELGALTQSAHQEIKDLLKELKLEDVTWLVGNHFSQDCNGIFNYFKNTEEVAKKLAETPLQEKQILIKGSRGIKLESLVKML